MGEAPLDEQLSAQLETFEEKLVASAVASSPFVTEAARHIIAAGGKRFRPLLVFLASRFGGEADEADLMRAAMVIELTHVASLYHDDVMDVADLRRGAPSANRLWGNSVAILVGDFLFARASTTVAELGVEYVLLQAETFARLVQGQIAETKGAYHEVPRRLAILRAVSHEAVRIETARQATPILADAIRLLNTAPTVR